jgi:hypothetical protein
MLLAFFITLISFVLSFHFFSPIVALIVIFVIGVYFIVNSAKTY